MYGKRADGLVFVKLYCSDSLQQHARVALRRKDPEKQRFLKYNLLG